MGGFFIFNDKRTWATTVKNKIVALITFKTHLNVRPFITILFVVFAVVFAVAQQPEQKKIDSLEQALTKPQHDSLRLKVINRLIYYYTDVNTERFVELAAE